jgi:xylulokinase
MAGQARLVAGVDSLTQATKVVVRQADTGVLVGQGRASHPEGTEVDPAAWEQALEAATAGGLLDEVAAVSVGAQQHGMVCVDQAGQVVCPALLWNDTRSAGAAVDLIGELGGPQAWAEATGLGAGGQLHRGQAALAGHLRARPGRTNRGGAVAP